MRMNKEIVMVRLSDIIPNRFQPRLTFDEEALNDLAASIKEHGIIQPLILRDLGNKYEIIAGERRYKASQLAGVSEVPAIIGEMDDQTSAELALIENIQRKDLSAIEEAKSYKKILDMGGFTQEELAKRMGKGQSTIANKMRLLSLTNEVQAALMNNLISERHARCLLQVKEENKQKEVLNKIITNRMNVRDTDNYIKNMLGMNQDEPLFNNSTSNSLENTEEKKNVTVELSNNKEEFPKEEIKIPEPTNNEKESPNVYTQTDNIDFIDINNLTPENKKEEPQNIDVEIPKEEIEIPKLPEINSIIEEKENSRVEKMNENNIINETQNNKKIDNISRMKMATAIRLAKDTLDDIKTAGYNATLEEVDDGSNYQIIINIQK